MKRKVGVLLVGVSVLLAAYVLRRGSTPSPVSGGEAPLAVGAAIPVPAPKPQRAAGRSSLAVRASQPQPQVPGAATEAGPPAQEDSAGDWVPKVEAIMAGAGNQFHALVGDVLVSEGSVVHGYRVRKVQADGVQFEKDGQIRVQKLN